MWFWSGYVWRWRRGGLFLRMPTQSFWFPSSRLHFPSRGRAAVVLLCHLATRERGVQIGLPYRCCFFCCCCCPPSLLFRGSFLETSLLPSTFGFVRVRCFAGGGRFVSVFAAILFLRGRLVSTVSGQFFFLVLRVRGAAAAPPRSTSLSDCWMATNQRRFLSVCIHVMSKMLWRSLFSDWH